MPASRSEKLSHLLVAVQAVVGAGTLAVLVFGVFVLRSVDHMAEESVVLGGVHASSTAIHHGLFDWNVDSGGVLSVPADLPGLAQDLRVQTGELRDMGRSDAAKADDIERRLDLVVTEAERFSQSANPNGMVAVELVAAISSLQHTTLGYWLDEIDELEESRAIVSVTRTVLLVLGPLFVVIGFWSAAAVARLRARAERADAAEQLVRAKDDFIARVSHEIRTPLTGILGFSELLRAENQEPGDASDLAGVIADLSADVAGLIEDLLIASVADQGALSLDMTEVDLRSVVEASAASFKEGASVAVGTGAARALADSARVRQILRNLISNAIRYGGSHIAVDIFSNNGTVSVVVSDDGPPIVGNVAATMFESYTTTGGEGVVPGGIGIGLPISRDLARRMGGDLTYRRTGDRSEFVLDLVAARSFSMIGGEGAASPPE